MQRIICLVGTMLLIAVSAAAQGPAGAGSSGSSPRGQGKTRTFSIREYSTWQVALGYQYNQINLLGSPFTTNGLNVSAVRYLGRWFGVEGQAGFGFGNTGTTSTPPNLNTQSLFFGGGPRLAYRNRGRIEPWIHGVFGEQHFRFNQTAGVLGSNTALAGAAGGGVDYLLGTHTAFRAEADFIGSRFFSANQRHFQVVSGLVFNF
ncbi:MAG: hypothetical protein LAO08_09305 [Acidobacteriia bacterium]|nr:hypothetical protein [Terriglobia bacterium]